MAFCVGFKTLLGKKKKKKMYKYNNVKDNSENENVDYYPSTTYFAMISSYSISYSVTVTC